MSPSGRGVGHDDVAQHESAARGKHPRGALEVVRLRGAVEMMNGKGGNDDVEGTGRERVLKSRDEQLHTFGQERRAA